MKKISATSELQSTAVDCKNQNEGELDYKKLLLVPNEDLTDKQKTFLTVHSEMVMAGQKSAECFLIMANDLRRMRDEELYKAAGFDTFKDYVETALEIKERQAYTWISVLNLPSEYLKKNAKMGVTKLALIASASDTVAEDLMNDEATSRKSSRELEEIIKSKEKEIAGKDEQISSLTDELAAEQAKNAELSAAVPEVPDNKELEEKIKKLAAQLEEANESLREAEDKLEENEERIRELNDREPEVITQTVEKTVEVENPETQKALKEAQKQAESAKAEKVKAEQEARKYQNELAAYKKTQEEISTFKVHAANLFEIWDTVIEAVAQIKAVDPDYASKCIVKLVAFSETVKSDIEGVQE